jgi:hypothetical protein
LALATLAACIALLPAAPIADAAEPGSIAVPVTHKGSTVTATEMEVIERQTSSRTSAKLSATGRISGTVTDAATHTPLAHVEVAAENASAESWAGMRSNGNEQIW